MQNNKETQIKNSFGQAKGRRERIAIKHKEPKMMKSSKHTIGRRFSIAIKKHRDENEEQNTGNQQGEEKAM